MLMLGLKLWLRLRLIIKNVLMINLLNIRCWWFTVDEMLVFIIIIIIIIIIAVNGIDVVVISRGIQLDGEVTLLLMVKLVYGSVESVWILDGGTHCVRFLIYSDGRGSVW